MLLREDAKLKTIKQRVDQFYKFSSIQDKQVQESKES